MTPPTNTSPTRLGRQRHPHQRCTLMAHRVGDLFTGLRREETCPRRRRHARGPSSERGISSAAYLTNVGPAGKIQQLVASACWVRGSAGLTPKRARCALVFEAAVQRWNGDSWVVQSRTCRSATTSRAPRRQRSTGVGSGSTLTVCGRATRTGTRHHWCALLVVAAVEVVAVGPFRQTRNGF